MQSLALFLSNNFSKIVKSFYLKKKGLKQPLRNNKGNSKILHKLVSELIPLDKINSSSVSLNSEAADLKELANIVIKELLNNFTVQEKLDEKVIENITEVISEIYHEFWEIRLKHYNNMQAEIEHRLLTAVVAAQENERKNLALTLHDDIVQSMAGILFRIQMVRSMIANHQQSSESKVTAKLIETEDMLRKTIQSCRIVSFDMDSFWLEQAGFIPTLKSFIRDYENKNEISVSLKLEEFSGNLKRELEIHFFRVIQEALRNTQKHAFATKVNIYLSLNQKRAILSIEDNGCGFNFSKEYDIKNPGLNHFGLFSIEQRSKMLGGLFQIKTAPGCGTELLLEVPLQQNEPKTFDHSGGRRVSPWIQSV